MLPRTATRAAVLLQRGADGPTRGAALATSAACTIGELVDRALDEYERAGLRQPTREALAEQPGVEMEDHDVFAPALKDDLQRGW